MKQLFFDLDGTIVDSSKGIFASIRYALGKMNKPELDPATLRTFIGPPLLDSFQRVGFTKAEAEEAVLLYRENYRSAGLLAVEVYPDLAETLAVLEDSYQLNVATSKPELFAKQILKNIGLAKHFTGIYGADMEGKRIKKEDVLRYALLESKNQDPQQAHMIGDREHDMIGGVKNAVIPVGILWGFGDRDELMNAGAEVIVATPKELQSFFI